MMPDIFSIFYIGITIVLGLLTWLVFVNINAFNSNTVRLFRCLKSNSIDLPRALSLIDQLTSKDLCSYVSKNVSFVMYIANLIISEKNVDRRKDLRSILIRICKKAQNINEISDGKFIIDELVKAKEIFLSKEIVIAGAKAMTSDVFLSLFHIANEVIYLSVLILLGLEVLRQSTTESDNLDIILGTNSDVNVVSHQDLLQLSTTYQSIVQKYCHAKSSSVYIEFSDILASLSEAASHVFELLLNTRSLSDIVKLLSKTDSYNRNLLHTLGLSGSIILTNQLIEYFKNKSLEDGYEEYLKQLGDALATRDTMGHTPISYTHMRYPSSTVYDAMITLAQLIFTSKEYLDIISQRIIPEEKRILFNKWEIEKEMKELNIKRLIDSNNQHNDYHGGWEDTRIPYEVVPIDDRCDVEVVWTGMPSKEEFLYKYVFSGKPVIFRGAGLGNEMSLRHTCHKDFFLTTYGDKVRVDVCRSIRSLLLLWKWYFTPTSNSICCIIFYHTYLIVPYCTAL